MGSVERRFDEGFSLTELMTVVAILAILVAVAVASYQVSTESSRRVACLQNQKSVRSAVLSYQVDHSGQFPPDLDTVKNSVEWSGDFATCVSTDATFTYDPATGDVACPTPGHE